ncbi:MAG: protein kinase [Actinobacteria bacterium]|nr:protein kinase [Actinomycetota bacterium]
MQFKILGHIEVDDDGGPIGLGGPKQRTVLAHLLLRANQVVPTDVLIDEVWGEEPPGNPRNTLQTYISHLRKAIGRERIDGRSGGYVLHAEPDEVDASRFEALMREARAAPDDPASVSATLGEALAMWRGPPLADLADEPSLAGEIARLEDLRLTATERWLAAQIDAGHHTTVVGELEVLTQRHPMHERLWASLMLALYRTGRQADALAAYQKARQVLADQLGIDPSPELQELYRQILRQDAALDAAPEPPPPTAPSVGLGWIDLAVGAEFAGYRIDGVLGSGGTSVVYLAEHLGLRRKVALKVMTPAFAETPGAKDRFVRESQLAAAIDHPNVIPIYEAGDVEGHLFIAMRYVEGSDLRTVLGSDGPMEPERVLRIVRQVAGALDAAHARGLVHRDVKPGNVLLTGAEGPGGEHVYLSDFGITRAAVDPSITGVGRFVGTLDYAAPEQFEGGDPTPQTDVYSLGCVLYECFAGSPPFRREIEAAVMYAHLVEEPPSLASERPDLPGAIDEVIGRSLAKAPEHRFRSARELADALEGALTAGSVPPPSVAAPLRGERRWATVMYADAADVTAVIKDPEDAHDVAQAITRQMASDVGRYGGTVTTVMSDGVMAVFGAPTAHEDDAERAVRAALAMRASVPAADPRLAQVQLHVGIDTGEGMAAWVGPEWRSQYTFVGEATTAASRLRSASAPGEILVGRQTRIATERVIEFADRRLIGTLPQASAIEAWRVVGIREKPLERPGLAAPFVGRDAEFELLRSVWERVLTSRHPHLCTVIGAAGIGKSRLLREIAAVIALEGQVIMGRCLPFGETTGYDAFGQQVKRAAGILRSHPESAARELLDRHVGDLHLSDDAAEVASHLGVLLGFPTERTPDRQLLFFSARRYVEALARHRPTALAFEDLHWAEPALLDLIQWLAARVEDVPLLLLICARSQLMEAVPTWGAGLRHSALPLEPLREEESRELALRLLPSDRDHGGSIEELVATGGGNPLFLEELANAVPERTSASAAPLPGTIQTIIAARLDTLQPYERGVIQDASVIGRYFWRGALTTLEDGLGSLDDALELLETRDFIRRQPTSRIAGDPEFLFKHILTMEVAYATLPRPARRERHAAVARYLVDSLGDRAREHAALLAHHFKEAGEPTRAAPYLMTAAEVAAGAGAKAEAIALFTEAMTLAEEIGDDDLRVRALFGRIWSLMDTGEYTDALNDVEPLLEDPDPRVRGRAAHARSRLAFLLADTRGLRSYAERTLAIATELGDDRLATRAKALTGNASWLAGDREAFLRSVERAVEEWPEEDRDAEYGYMLAMVPLARYFDGRYEEGIRLAEEVFRLGTEQASLMVTLFSAGNVGAGLTGLSRHEEAFEWFERGVRLGRELEAKPVWTGRLLNMHAGALREIGCLDASRALNREGLEAGLEADFPASQISARIDLALTDLAEGEVGRAEGQLPAVRDAIEGARGWHQWLWTGRFVDMVALVALESGRLEDAASKSEESLRYIARYPRPKYEARTRITYGRVMLGLGMTSEAIESFRRALELAEQLGQAVLLWPAAHGMSRALERSGRGDEADAARRQALDVIETLGAALAPERRSQFLESAAVRAVMEDRDS